MLFCLDLLRGTGESIQFHYQTDIYANSSALLEYFVFGIFGANFVFVVKSENGIVIVVTWCTV